MSNEKSVIAFFPCDSFLGDLFCEYLFSELAAVEISALVLKKQEQLIACLKKYPFKEIFIIDEDFYGLIQRDESKKMLYQIKEQKYAQAMFPQSDFKGNAFLLGSVLAERVFAVNAAYCGSERSIIECGQQFSVMKKGALSKKEQVSSLLNQVKLKLTKQLDCFSNSIIDGERPTSGLLSDFPYDLDVFKRYVFLMEECNGKEVVDVGAGLGYGSYLMAQAAKSVIGLEKEDALVEFNKSCWAFNNLTFSVNDSEGIGLADNSCDCVVMLEVLEHVENPEYLLSEAYRVLRPGGQVFFSTPEPKLYPYRVNNKQAVGDANALLKMGIWPWHIRAIPLTEAVKITTKVGFTVQETLYPTYVSGAEFLRKIQSDISFEEKLDLLNQSCKWSIDDFSFIDEFSPVLSGYSYMIIATKV